MEEKRLIYLFFKKIRSSTLGCDVFPRMYVCVGYLFCLFAVFALLLGIFLPGQCWDTPYLSLNVVSQNALPCVTYLPIYKTLESTATMGRASLRPVGW